MDKSDVESSPGPDITQSENFLFLLIITESEHDMQNRLKDMGH
jgi:hypothetical protein